MAGEIKVTAKVEVRNGNFVDNNNEGVLSFDQSAIGGGTPGQVIATTTGVDVTLTGVTVPGWLRMRNLDGVANVEWGIRISGVDHLIGRMEPGEPATFRLKPDLTTGGRTFRLVASAGTPKVRVEIFED